MESKKIQEIKRIFDLTEEENNIENENFSQKKEKELRKRWAQDLLNQNRQNKNIEDFIDILNANNFDITKLNSIINNEEFISFLEKKENFNWIKKYTKDFLQLINKFPFLAVTKTIDHLKEKSSPQTIENILSKSGRHETRIKEIDAKDSINKWVEQYYKKVKEADTNFKDEQKLNKEEINEIIKLSLGHTYSDVQKAIQLLGLTKRILNFVEINSEIFYKMLSFKKPSSIEILASSYDPFFKERIILSLYLPKIKDFLLELSDEEIKGILNKIKTLKKENKSFNDIFKEINLNLENKFFKKIEDPKLFSGNPPEQEEMPIIVESSDVFIKVNADITTYEKIKIDEARNIISFFYNKDNETFLEKLNKTSTIKDIPASSLKNLFSSYKEEFLQKNYLYENIKDFLTAKIKEEINKAIEKIKTSTSDFLKRKNTKDSQQNKQTNNTKSNTLLTKENYETISTYTPGDSTKDLYRYYLLSLSEISVDITDGTKNFKSYQEFSDKINKPKKKTDQTTTQTTKNQEEKTQEENIIFQNPIIFLYEKEEEREKVKEFNIDYKVRNFVQTFQLKIECNDLKLYKINKSENEQTEIEIPENEKKDLLKGFNIETCSNK